MDSIQNKKRACGRPKVFTDEELKQHKIEYMRNTLWFCDICNQNFKITSKTNHLKTKIHHKNSQIRGKDSQIANLMNEILKLSHKKD